MIIAIDLEGFPAEIRHETFQLIKSICKESNVIEADQRIERNIDPVTLGVASGIISAVCSTIALSLQVTEARRKKNESEKNERPVTLIHTVESIQGLTLPLNIQNNLIKTLESQKQPIMIELEVEQTKYVIKTYSDEGAAMIQGRVKSQKP